MYGWMYGSVIYNIPLLFSKLVVLLQMEDIPVVYIIEYDNNVFYSNLFEYDNMSILFFICSKCMTN